MQLASLYLFRKYWTTAIAMPNLPIFPCMNMSHVHSEGRSHGRKQQRRAQALTQTMRTKQWKQVQVENQANCSCINQNMTSTHLTPRPCIKSTWSLNSYPKFHHFLEYDRFRSQNSGNKGLENLLNLHLSCTSHGEVMMVSLNRLHGKHFVIGWKASKFVIQSCRGPDLLLCSMLHTT